eukprot:3528816-Prymnesium_polylepis.1
MHMYMCILLVVRTPSASSIVCPFVAGGAVPHRPGRPPPNWKTTSAQHPSRLQCTLPYARALKPPCSRPSLLHGVCEMNALGAAARV